MPVYHFTFHTYGTWLPNRVEGYHKHGQGYQAPDPKQAQAYRQRMQSPAIQLQDQALVFVQGILVDSQPLQRFELYATAGEASHLHVVAAWHDDREPTHVRGQIKTSMSRALNKRFGKRKWFVAKAGQTPVVDLAHLDELVHRYLPEHGLFWKRENNGGDQS